MEIATWNLNNRVGKTRFRPEAAEAGAALGADVLVLTEFFPRKHEEVFRRTLADAGWPHQVMSRESSEIANRVLIASKVALEPLVLALPSFDQQFFSNIATAFIPSTGLCVVGVRVPFYKTTQQPLISQAWGWLEDAASVLSRRPTVVAGDLNVSTQSSAGRGGDHFRRILASGWHRAKPADTTTFVSRGGQGSEIDHILATRHCTLTDAISIRAMGEFAYCATPDALSDHAALKCRVEVNGIEGS